MFLWNPLESSQNFLRLLNQSFQVPLPSFFHLLLLPQCSLFCCLLQQVASSLEHITTAEGRSGEFVHQKISLLQLKTVSWHRTVTYPAFCTVKLSTVLPGIVIGCTGKKNRLCSPSLGNWNFGPQSIAAINMRCNSSSSSCCISISLRCSSSSSCLSDDLRHARVPVITMRYILTMSGEKVGENIASWRLVFRCCLSSLSHSTCPNRSFLKRQNQK